MYESFYGLSRKPFQMVPDPAFLYLGERYKNAITYLEYGLAERIGFILLTGDIGTGKTTLIKYLLARLEDDISPAVIFNTNVDANELLRLILIEYEIPPASSKADNVNALYDFLMDQYAKGKRPLLIIDEGQNLDWSALEEIRMLFNLQTENQLLLQVVLVGQSNLREKLKEPGLEQLRQRIGIRFHLSPLKSEETAEYIKARLVKAGGDPELFLPETIEMIHGESKGVPRTINILCDAALVYGVGDDLTRIPPATIREVMDQTLGHGLCMPVDHVAGMQQATILEENELGLADEKAQPSGMQKELTKISRQLMELGSRFVSLEQHVQAESFATILESIQELKEKTALLERKNLELESNYAALICFLDDKEIKEFEQYSTERQKIESAAQ